MGPGSLTARIYWRTHSSLEGPLGDRADGSEPPAPSKQARLKTKVGIGVAGLVLALLTCGFVLFWPGDRASNAPEGSAPLPLRAPETDLARVAPPDFLGGIEPIVNQNGNDSPALPDASSAPPTEEDAPAPILPPDPLPQLGPNAPAKPDVLVTTPPPPPNPPVDALTTPDEPFDAEMLELLAEGAYIFERWSREILAMHKQILGRRVSTQAQEREDRTKKLIHVFINQRYRDQLGSHEDLADIIIAGIDVNQNADLLEQLPEFKVSQEHLDAITQTLPIFERYTAPPENRAQSNRDARNLRKQWNRMLILGLDRAAGQMGSGAIQEGSRISKRPQP